MVTQTQRTSDEIASLFARGQRVGSWWLSAKQSQWLRSVAQREAERHGCETVQYDFSGHIVDHTGPTGVMWRVSFPRVTTNGCGLFRLADSAAEYASELADAEARLVVAREQLLAIESIIDQVPESIRDMYLENARNLVDQTEQEVRRLTHLTAVGA